MHLRLPGFDTRACYSQAAKTLRPHKEKGKRHGVTMHWRPGTVARTPDVICAVGVDGNPPDAIYPPNAIPSVGLGGSAVASMPFLENRVEVFQRNSVDVPNEHLTATRATTPVVEYYH